MEYGAAKRRAARDSRPSASSGELPGNDEVEDEVRDYLALFCADTQPAELAALREVAALWMERLAAFRPHLTGAVWRGTATRLSSVCIELYCDDSKAAEIALIDMRVDYDVGSVDGPRGRAVDVLNVQTPEPQRSASGVHVAPDRARPRRPARRAEARRARPHRARRPGGAARARGRRMKPARGARRRRRSGRRGARPARDSGAARRTGRRRRAPPRSISGRSASPGPKAPRSRWRACAASRCCSTSGRPGARPASTRCRCSTASRASAPRAGWQVLGLAVDQPDPVRRFVAERNLRFPIALAGASGLDLSRQLGNRSGGLPFTPRSTATGTKVHHHLGARRRRAPAPSWVRSTR